MGSLETHEVYGLGGLSRRDKNEGFRAGVYSQLVGTGNRADYAARLGIPIDRVLPRNITNIDEVSDEFDDLL